MQGTTWIAATTFLDVARWGDAALLVPGRPRYTGVVSRYFTLSMVASALSVLVVVVLVLDESFLILIACPPVAVVAVNGLIAATRECRRQPRTAGLVVAALLHVVVIAIAVAGAIAMATIKSIRM